MKKLLAITLALTLVFTLFACGETDVEDATGNAEIEIATDPTGTEPHTHAYTETVTKAATCTEAGSKTLTCTCGDSYTEEISAPGHTMTGWQRYTDGKEYAPDEYRNSCTVCGFYESKQSFNRMMFRYADLANTFGYFEKGQLPEVADVISAAFWGDVPCESTNVDYVYYHTIKIADLDDFTRKCLGTTYDYTQIQNLWVLCESRCNYDAAKNAIVIEAYGAGGGDGFMRDQVTWTTEDDIHFTVSVKYVSYEVEGQEYTQFFTVEKVENNYIITSVGA